jgi:hypothetical protein
VWELAEAVWRGLDVTFSNRREPTFGDAHPAPHQPPHHGPHIGTSDVAAHKARAGGLTRMVSSVQIIGSLLAVPLGLASGYSMYKANFAADTTCQNLRAGIVAMLDKNVDAATRRMLVRRDITIFEETCGGFDPDAHAAFKTLLAVPSAPVANAAAPKLRSALPATEVAGKAEPKVEPKVEAKAEKAEPKVEAKAEAKSESKTASKPEPRRAVAEKTPAVVPAPASLESIEREAAVSDTRWLAAVRSALVTNNTEIAAPARIEQQPGETKTIENVLAEPTALKPARAETLAVAKPAQPAVQLHPTWNVPPQTAATAPAQTAVAAPVQTPAPAQTVAPDLAAPTIIAPPVAVAPVPDVAAPSRSLDVTTVRDNAPRPPGSITGPTSINPPEENDESTKSKIGSWIAQIPLVGRVIEPRKD